MCWELPRHINQQYGLSLKTYAQLHKWSVDKLEDFCREAWSFCGMVYSVAPDRVGDGLDAMWPRPRWFPGARLNYAENLLACGLATHPDAVAVSACREAGSHWRHLTWTQLRDQVALYATALRNLGVTEGDRVATVTTNSIETLLILLACGSLGAILTCTAPDMGAKGILERYLQIKPKLLFVDSDVLYAGRTLDLRNKLKTVVAELVKRVPNLTRVVVTSGPTWDDPSVIALSKFLDVEVKALTFTQLPFDHPIYILYSSGTTGPPKCICHAAGGALLQQKKDYILGFDMGPDDVYYQYTTVGWMMWHYLVGALSVGARVVLYDGSPLHPTPEYQIQLLSQQGVTHYGTSPKFLAALKHHGVTRMPSLEGLKVTLSSGAPLSAEICDWFNSVFPEHVGLVSGSGGTDLVAGIVGSTPLLPAYRGELAAAILGMSVEIWDLNGQNIEDSGEKGDLVVTKPFFSMPVTFWGEGGEEKYRKAYFDTFPGIWHHGDFIRKNLKTQGYEILGRSDGVLNPGGVRFGTAELYGIIDKFPQIQDYIAVGQRRPNDSDEQVLLFLKMKNGPLEQELRESIQRAIRQQLSPRHVPAHILEVKNIPYTMNGKRIEALVRDVVCGREAKVGGMAINPESLEEYRKFVDLPIITTRAKL